MADPYQRHYLATPKAGESLKSIVEEIVYLTKKQDQAETQEERLRCGIMLKNYGQMLGGLAVEMHDRIFKEEGVYYGKFQTEKLRTISRPS